jgi:hypothetical protein
MVRLLLDQATAARGLAPPEEAASASDEAFLVWEREAHRLARRADEGDLGDEAFDALSKERLRFELLALETPSASIAAALVKVRMLVQLEAKYLEPSFVMALRHVLGALEAVDQSPRRDCDSEGRA